MYQVIPNSHRWNYLETIIRNIEFDIQWRNSKKEREERIKNADHMIVDMHEPLTIEYLLIGLANTMSDKTELVFNGDFETLRKNTDPHFTCVKDMIEYLQVYREDKDVLESWTLERFKIILENTLECGFDLKPRFKMEKSEVYRNVDGELDYQQLRWVVRRDANGTPDEEKPPAEWLNYMQQHINDANKAVYLLNDEEAMAQIRKVVALGVRALMIHGCPERVIPEELLNQD